MDDRQFQQLLVELGYSYAGYRRIRKGVKKRIRRHMRALDCSDIEAYLDRLNAVRPVREACIRRMAVPISRFMRDRAFWAALKTEWLPELHRSFGSRLKAWSAGCACGEEAYSLAMTVFEHRADLSGDTDFSMEILATDLNPVCLAKARAGIYSASSLREVSDELIDRYFKALRRRRRYCIRPDLGGLITWRRGRIEAALPNRGFHLVLMRNNVLTYFEAPARKQVLAHVLTGLLPGGMLVIGERETLPAGRHGLANVSRSLPYVYRKVIDH